MKRFMYKAGAPWVTWIKIGGLGPLPNYQIYGGWTMIIELIEAISEARPLAQAVIIGGLAFIGLSLTGLWIIERKVK